MFTGIDSNSSDKSPSFEMVNSTSIEPAVESDFDVLRCRTSRTVDVSARYSYPQILQEDREEDWLVVGCRNWRYWQKSRPTRRSQITGDSHLLNRLNVQERTNQSRSREIKGADHDRLPIIKEHG
jgi:hypothetical protein